MFRPYISLIVALLLSAILISSCSTESKPAYTLTTSLNPAEGGTVEPSSGIFEENEAIRLRATPTDGWVFVRWELDLASTVNPINITIDSDYSIVAVFERREPTDVVEVKSLATGRIWMDRNLGASRAATSINDEEAYGNLFQWGRPADRHEFRNSSTITSLSSSDTPEHNDFILSTTTPYDWRDPQNENLWQGLIGNNNPCPEEFRLPTSGEWEAERQSWTTIDRDGAFSSPLKLPVAGYRDRENGSVLDTGTDGHYWSGTVSGPISRSLQLSENVAGMNNSSRATGFSVRCIKN